MPDVIGFHGVPAPRRRLARMIVEIAVEEGLIDSILDDDGGADG